MTVMISNTDRSGRGHCQQTFWNKRTRDHWKKWHHGNGLSSSFHCAKIFHSFTLTWNKIFETNHSNFEFMSEMPRAVTYACACWGKSARKNNLSSIQTSLICILTNFKETSMCSNQTCIKCFLTFEMFVKAHISVPFMDFLWCVSFCGIKWFFQK